MEQPNLAGHSAPEKIVIFRALQLGDLLCAVPAWRALRRAHPQAEIRLIGLPWAKSFVQRFSHYLDGLIEFPGYPGLPETTPLISALPTFLQRLQAQQFDLAVQMHGDGTDINPLLVLLGARHTAGFYLPGRYCPDETRFLPYPAHESEVWRHLRLMERLDIPLHGDDLEFPLTAADFEALHALPETRDLQPGHYVCLHVGARSPDRRWPPERFSAVGDALAAAGLRIVLTGTEEEAPLTQAVAALLHNRPIDLVGKTTLGTLSAVLSQARLLISNDTGISHVAAALRVPSVIIAGFDTPRWAPLNHDRHRVVYDPAVPEADRVLSSTVNERCLRDACMQLNAGRRKFSSRRITVGDVLNEVNDLLQHAEAAPPAAVATSF